MHNKELASKSMRTDNEEYGWREEKNQSNERSAHGINET